jgi:hypothetical protein
LLCLFRKLIPAAAWLQTGAGWAAGLKTFRRRLSLGVKIKGRVRDFRGSRACWIWWSTGCGLEGAQDDAPGNLYQSVPLTKETWSPG